MAGKEKRKLNKKILLVLLLLICVAASTLAVMQQMQIFLPNDEGAISLNGDENSNGNSENQESGEQGEDPQTGNGGQQDQSGDSSTDGLQNEGSSEGQNGSGEQNGSSTANQIRPGMQTEDNQVTWEQDTKIEIFKTSYDNESGEVTVLSNNGDKVIAPGTQNTYVFKLKNTGNVALDFKVELSSLLSAVTNEIPIQVRISNFKNEWIVGSDDEYVDVSKVSAVDYGTVGAGRYIYYTLDWMWPFEGDTDTNIIDTALGDLIVEGHFEFSMALRTESAISTNPDATDGIIAPQMGDANSMVLWITLIGVSLVVMLFLIIFRNKDDEEEEQLQMEEKDGESDSKSNKRTE